MKAGFLLAAGAGFPIVVLGFLVLPAALGMAEDNVRVGDTLTRVSVRDYLETFTLI